MMNFESLTVGQIIELAQSTNLDDMQLAKRLARRIELTVRQNIADLNDAEHREMLDLAGVTDRELSILEFCQWPAHAESENIPAPKEISAPKEIVKKDEERQKRIVAIARERYNAAHEELQAAMLKLSRIELDVELAKLRRPYDQEEIDNENQAPEMGAGD
jgi:hypothetical protein